VAGHRTIQVGSEDGWNADVTLGPVAHLSGTLEFAGGCPAKDVWVGLDGDVMSTPEALVRLDGSGHFDLGMVAPGRYRISAGVCGVSESRATSVKLGDTEG
jgi:hypothetical protein